MELFDYNGNPVPRTVDAIKFAIDDEDAFVVDIMRDWKIVMVVGFNDEGDPIDHELQIFKRRHTTWLYHMTDRNETVIIKYFLELTDG
jgi:hypothetical protein